MSQDTNDERKTISSIFPIGWNNISGGSRWTRKERHQRVTLPSGKQILKAQQTFEEALDKIKPVASAIISKLRDLNQPADEVEVKFGLKLTADAGAIFASVGGEVSYEITLKWTNNSEGK